MGFGSFVKDRLIYVAVYTGFGLLAVTVVQLDLWLSGTSLQFANLVYLLLLGFVGLMLFLGWEYRRQVHFLQYLRQITGDEPIEELAVLPVAITLEGGLFAQAWGRMYARLSGALTAERERAQRNISLVSQWAHHMKTPVSVIDLTLQKSGSEGWPPQARLVLESIAEENQRLQHALQMLLNMVRLEDFAGDFRVQRVDLPRLARQVINDRKREFILRRVYPRVEVPNEAGGESLEWTVETDAKWLRFVLEQLLSNALKYAAPQAEDGPEGRVQVRLYREQGDVILEVADNGIGIPPEDMGRVFDSFFTGLNGRAFPQSSGMGLFLAREVCSRLGHQLYLESVRGEGTRVRIHIRNRQTIFSGLTEMAPSDVTGL